MRKIVDCRKHWSIDDGWLKVPGKNLCHLITNYTVDWETGTSVSLTACKKDFTVTRVDTAAKEHIVKTDTRRCGLCLPFLEKYEKEKSNA